MTMPERIWAAQYDDPVSPMVPGHWTDTNVFSDTPRTLYILAAPRPMSEYDPEKHGAKVLAWWPDTGNDNGTWTTTLHEVNAGGLPHWHCAWHLAAPGDDDAPTHFLPHPQEPT